MHLSHLNYFLGLESSSYSGCYFYLMSYMLLIFCLILVLINNKIANIPFEVNVKFSLIRSTILNDPTFYRQLVKNLIYLIAIRLDITYIIYIVSQFITAPLTIHFTTMFCIIQFIKSTLFHGLYFFTYLTSKYVYNISEDRVEKWRRWNYILLYHKIQGIVAKWVV